MHPQDLSPRARASNKERGGGHKINDAAAVYIYIDNAAIRQLLSVVAIQGRSRGI